MGRPAFRRSLWALVAAAAWLGWAPAAAAARADFGQHVPSAEASHVADWVLHSRDHAGEPFVVVDKAQSRVYVFDGGGVLLGAAPALVGLTRGDHTVPGVGLKAISAIRVEERTTPSGRFAASLGRGMKNDEILWVDYESGVALHAVSPGVPKERRLQRLASLVPDERRITFGCINVPAKFFSELVAPLFRGRAGIVYVLPETRSAREAFGSYDLPAPGAAEPPATPR